MRFNFLAIIPARKDDKGVDNRNLANLNGKPLINWTIEAAQGSRILAKPENRIFVSTNDPETADIARQQGIDVPFLRGNNPELYKDVSGSVALALEALDFFEAQGQKFDYVVLLEPTTPLRTAAQIDQALEDSYNNVADGYVGMGPAGPGGSDYHARLKDDGSFDRFVPRQETEAANYDHTESVTPNGSIYIVAAPYLRMQKSYFLKQGMYGMAMDAVSSHRVIDQVSLEKAEKLMSERLVNDLKSRYPKTGGRPSSYRFG